MVKNSSLSLRNIQAGIDGKGILKGITFEVFPGQVQVVMGPNGSGKSTLAQVLMGNPEYKLKVKSEKLKVRKQEEGIWLGDKEITHMPPEERAKLGIYLAFQSPITIPGVTVSNLLRTAYQETHRASQEKSKESLQNPVLARRWSTPDITLSEFIQIVKKSTQQLHLDESLLSRFVHDGFSGGEKKKIEMLQALVLKPKFAIFDEIDTGLDVDALATVGRGIELLKKEGTGIVVITHYQRILRFVKPDVVHVMVDGRIVESGDKSLISVIEEKGYKQFTQSFQ